jgi:hypothetical protein
VSFSSSSFVLIINPYLEYRRAYGGGVDDRVERRGWTGGFSVRPCGSRNLIDELRVAPMPPKSKVSFLLDGAVSSSILRGDSETKCLLKELVDDGLDDEEPFFLEKRLVVFSHMVVALFLTSISRVLNGSKAHKNYRSMDF